MRPTRASPFGGCEEKWHSVDGLALSQRRRLKELSQGGTGSGINRVWPHWSDPRLEERSAKGYGLPQGL